MWDTDTLGELNGYAARARVLEERNTQLHAELNALRIENQALRTELQHTKATVQAAVPFDGTLTSAQAKWGKP